MRLPFVPATAEGDNPIVPQIPPRLVQTGRAAVQTVVVGQGHGAKAGSMERASHFGRHLVRPSLRPIPSGPNRDGPFKISHEQVRRGEQRAHGAKRIVVALAFQDATARVREHHVPDKGKPNCPLLGRHAHILGSRQKQRRHGEKIEVLGERKRDHGQGTGQDDGPTSPGPTCQRPIHEYSTTTKLNFIRILAIHCAQETGNSIHFCPADSLLQRIYSRFHNAIKQFAASNQSTCPSRTPSRTTRTPSPGRAQSR